MTQSTPFPKGFWWGYRPTFGIIGVDRQTQLRARKPSAHWLGAIARFNGATFND